MPFNKRVETLYSPPSKRRKFNSAGNASAQNNNGQISDQSVSNMKVFVRVRPLNPKEMCENYRTVVKVVDDKLLIFDQKEEEEQFFFRGVKQKMRDMTKKQHKEMDFLFDGVFDASATNVDVHNKTTHNIISCLLEGYNCSVFVYGATGAGKTHTMLGSRDNPGIMYHTMAELYFQIDKIKKEKECQVGVSFVEVYNESVHNLLHPSGPMHLREDANGVTVAGLKVEDIFNAEQLLEKLSEGNRNRTQHPTDANAESSRSHAVFQVYVRMSSLDNGQVKIVKLSMIDLAGSERGMATGCVGPRFKEGANINKSLLALGNCISNLADGLRHIPYRDSKLTRLLKDSLGGNCFTVMIANVSPSSASYEDTYNTLKYATRAKKIKTKVSKNVMSVNLHVSHYVKLVDDLKKEITLLKSQVRAQGSSKSRSPGRQQDTTMWCRYLDGLFEERMKIHTEILSLQSQEKTLTWRINHKRFIANILSNTSVNKVQGLDKVEESLRQFEARSAAILSKKAELKQELEINNENILKLYAEMDEAHVSQYMEKELQIRDGKLSKAEMEIQVLHMKKLLLLQHKRDETAVHSIKTLFGTLSEYYNILSGLKMITSSMEGDFQKSRQLLEGIKSISWSDVEEEEDLTNVSNNICSMFTLTMDTLQRLHCQSQKPKPISLALDEEDDVKSANPVTPSLEKKDDLEHASTQSETTILSSEMELSTVPLNSGNNDINCLAQKSSNLNETINITEIKQTVSEPANLNETVTLDLKPATNIKKKELPTVPFIKASRNDTFVLPGSKVNTKLKKAPNKENQPTLSMRLFKKPVATPASDIRFQRTALISKTPNIMTPNNKQNVIKVTPSTLKMRSKTRTITHPYKSSNPSGK